MTLTYDVQICCYKKMLEVDKTQTKGLGNDDMIVESNNEETSRAQLTVRGKVCRRR